MVWAVVSLVVAAVALRPANLLHPFIGATRAVFPWLWFPSIAILLWALLGPSSNVPHYPWLAFATTAAFVVMLWAFAQSYITDAWFDQLSSALLLVVLVICTIALCTPSYTAVGQGWINTLPLELRVPHGGFQQPNVFASFISAAYLWHLYRFLRPGEGTKPSRFSQGVLALAMLAVPLTVFLSGSRTGMLGLSVGLIGLCGWVAVVNRTRAARIWLLFAILLCAIAWLMADHGLTDGRSASRIADLPEGTSTLSRFGMWKLGLALWRGAPWFGHGLGSIAQLIDIKSQSPDWTGQALMGVVNIDHPHNETILWLAETGVIGTLFIVGPFVGVIFAVALWLRGNGFAWLCALFPIALHTQTEFPLHASAWHWVLLALILASGLIEVRGRTPATSHEPLGLNQTGTQTEQSGQPNGVDRRTFVWRIPVATLGVLASLFCLHTALVIYNSAMLRSASYPSVIHLLEATAAGPEMTHPVYGQYARDSWVMFAMPLALQLDSPDLHRQFCGELQGVYTRWRNPEIKGWMKRCELQR